MLLGLAENVWTKGIQFHIRENLPIIELTSKHSFLLKVMKIIQDN